MTHSDVPTVLFVCASNAGKSVMAQALMNKLAGPHPALSAGTHAKGAVNALSAQSLAELGIDVDHRPTQLDDAFIAAVDLIVIVGTAAQPDLPEHGPPVEIWDTDEPSLRGIEGLERMPHPRRYRRPCRGVGPAPGTVIRTGGCRAPAGFPSESEVVAISPVYGAPVP